MTTEGGHQGERDHRVRHQERNGWGWEPHAGCREKTGFFFWEREDEERLEEDKGEKGVQVVLCGRALGRGQ